MGQTKISWTESTWNPVRGCTRVTRECTNCYAEGMTARFSGADKRTGLPMYGTGFATMTPAGPRWTNEVALIESKLHEPLRWKKPRMIFVNSMSDLFHEKLPWEDIRQVYRVMRRCPHHVFQVLTKRPERRREIFEWWNLGAPENVWEGTSIGIRSRVDKISVLRDTPAAVRFLSCEPLLEDLGELDLTGIDWLIIGGESGPKARPMMLAWTESLINQCQRQGVACFFKQTGAVLAKTLGLTSRSGANPAEWTRGWPQEFPLLPYPAPGYVPNLPDAEQCIHPESLAARLIERGTEG